MVQTDCRTCYLFYFTGSQKVIKVRMRMENLPDGKTQLLHLMKNSFWRTARIHDDGLLRDRIADDRAITSKGRNREGFPNQRCHVTAMLPSNNQAAQARAFGTFFTMPSV